MQIIHWEHHKLYFQKKNGKLNNHYTWWKKCILSLYLNGGETNNISISVFWMEVRQITFPSLYSHHFHHNQTIYMLSLLLLFIYLFIIYIFNEKRVAELMPVINYVSLAISLLSKWDVSLWCGMIWKFDDMGWVEEVLPISLLFYF